MTRPTKDQRQAAAQFFAPLITGAAVRLESGTTFAADQATLDMLAAFLADPGDSIDEQVRQLISLHVATKRRYIEPTEEERASGEAFLLAAVASRPCRMRKR